MTILSLDLLRLIDDTIDRTWGLAAIRAYHASSDTYFLDTATTISFYQISSAEAGNKTHPSRQIANKPECNGSKWQNIFLVKSLDVELSWVTATTAGAVFMVRFRHRIENVLFVQFKAQTANNSTDLITNTGTTGWEWPPHVQCLVAYRTHRSFMEYVRYVWNHFILLIFRHAVHLPVYSK